jgi:Holliday junction resolvase RusA-like endonuclease
MPSDPPIRYPGQTLVGNPAFWELVNGDNPDFIRIKELITGAYLAETGAGNATDKAVSSWLFKALRSNPNLRRGVSTDNTPARQIILPSLAVKFDYLIQRPCFTCLPYQRVQYIRFILHTDPVSRQADRQMAFKKAVQAYLFRVNHDFTDFYNERLCVAVLFAMRASVKRTDVDNMAKTLLDAMQGYAYANDGQVDHLDVIRLDTGSDDAFIGIRVAVTGIAGNLEVIWPEFDVRWVGRLGIEPIDITPFL